jgi:hypothetical protein
MSRTGISELERSLHAEDCQWVKTVRHAEFYWPNELIASPCGHGQVGICSDCWPCTCLGPVDQIDRLEIMTRRLHLWRQIKGI